MLREKLAFYLPPEILKTFKLCDSLRKLTLTSHEDVCSVNAWRVNLVNHDSYISIGKHYRLLNMYYYLVWNRPESHVPMRTGSGYRPLGSSNSDDILIQQRAPV